MNIPAALRSRTEAGGVFNMKVKLLSYRGKTRVNGHWQDGENENKLES